MYMVFSSFFYAIASYNKMQSKKENKLKSSKKKSYLGLNKQLKIKHKKERKTRNHLPIKKKTEKKISTFLTLKINSVQKKRNEKKLNLRKHHD